MNSKDYTKQGILDWICFQMDDKDMNEIIVMCQSKINAMNGIKERVGRLVNTNTKNKQN